MSAISGTSARLSGVKSGARSGWSRTFMAPAISASRSAGVRLAACLSRKRPANAARPSRSSGGRSSSRRWMRMPRVKRRRGSALLAGSSRRRRAAMALPWPPAPEPGRERRSPRPAARPRASAGRGAACRRDADRHPAGSARRHCPARRGNWPRPARRRRRGRP